MQVRAIFCLSFLAGASLLAAQSPQVVTQSDGNKLTYSAEGVSFTGPDGVAKTIPAQWLNQNCPDLSKSGLADPDSYLKEVCATWAKYNEQQAAQAQQEPQQPITEPPVAIPDNCPIIDVIAVTTHGRSEAYNLLGFELAALSVGHQAESDSATAVKAMNSDAAKDPVGMLADVFQKLNLATDEYRCGAYIVGQYKAAGENQQIGRATTISVYNRLATINARMKKFIEGRFRNVDNPNGNVLENANTLADLTNDRKAAFSDLVSVTTYSGLLSIYAGDPTAKVADTLNMSGAERQQLMTQVNDILKTGAPDGFTQVADLLKTFLDKHPKVLN